MSDHIPSKRCTQCGVEYPATEQYFPKRRTVCKQCVHQKSARYRSEHKEQIAARKARWRVEHQEQVDKYHAQYRTEHKDKIKAYGTQYRVAHKEEILAWQAWHYIEHREKIRQYRSEHKKPRRQSKLNRRARKHGLPDTFNADEMAYSLRYWKFRCAYCGRSLAQLDFFNDIVLHFDHYIPLADPRPDNPGTVATNMLPTCSKCNLSKQDKDPEAWVTRHFKKKAISIIMRIRAYFTSFKEERIVSQG